MKPLTLVCTDFSSCSEAALERASELVDRAESRVLLLHVCAPHAGEHAGEWHSEAMRELRRARDAHFGKLSDNEVQYDAVASNQPATAICEVAEKNGAELIILGSHGRTGVMRRLLGSVAETVVRNAPCSVFVVRHREPAT